MADGETLVQETAEQGTTPEVVSDSGEVEMPITVADTPMEATLNSVPTESGEATQTLNPAETGSGAVGGGEPLINTNTNLDSGSESRMTQIQYEPGPQIKSGETQLVQAVGGFGMRELLLKAKDAIQFRKRKKLDKVMGLFASRTSVTNDEVEKLLHVSDSTATRYLSILEKEGKIQQTGKTGRSVSYTKI